MKKIDFKILALIFLAALSFSSCSSDDSGDSNGTTTGNYFPMAVNNKWNYTDGSTFSEVNLIGTTSFGGATYYEITDTENIFNNQNWVAKKGASYYQKTGAITTTESGVSISIESYEVKILKDDVAVGENWSGSASPKVTYSGSSGSGSFRARISYEGSIYAKDVTEEIQGVTYNNVIKVNTTVVVNSNGQINTIQSAYWFAKDVGIIFDNTTSTVDNITKTRYLTSYTLY